RHLDVVNNSARFTSKTVRVTLLTTFVCKKRDCVQGTRGRFAQKTAQTCPLKRHGSKGCQFWITLQQIPSLGCERFATLNCNTNDGQYGALIWGHSHKNGLASELANPPLK